MQSNFPFRARIIVRAAKRRYTRTAHTHFVCHEIGSQTIHLNNEIYIVYSVSILSRRIPVGQIKRFFYLSSYKRFRA